MSLSSAIGLWCAMPGGKVAFSRSKSGLLLCCLRADYLGEDCLDDLGETHRDAFRGCLEQTHESPEVDTDDLVLSLVMEAP